MSTRSNRVQLREVWHRDDWMRTVTQRRVLDYMRVYEAVLERPATVREIGAALGMTSTGQVSYHLGRLEQRGDVVRPPVGMSSRSRVSTHPLHLSRRVVD